MTRTPLHGLIAASYTPFDEAGRIAPGRAAAHVEALLADDVRGLYVNGSTGEGPSLTSDERREMAEAFVAAAAGRVPVFVQVGHTSLREASDLAAHAASIGADAISACAPFYFPVPSEALLIDSLQRLVGDCPLPFYYYHIPRLTGAALSMPAFLDLAAERLPTLAGIKFSDPWLHEFQSCQAAAGGAYEILWGVDEMLLAALATGTRATVGSTYNLAPRLYVQLMQAFESGDLEEARALQQVSVDLVRHLNRYGNLHAAAKIALRHRGFDLGAVRLPLPDLGEEAARDFLEGLAPFAPWAIQST